MVSGGETQFKISGIVMLVQFIGITLEKSRGVSIMAAATTESTAFFVDCEWRQNEGPSAILMMAIDNGKAAMVDNTAMIVGVLRSNFTDNDLVDAAVLNVGGSLVVEETLFLRNVARDGAIGVIEGGRISVLDSCFIKNSGGAVNTKENSTSLRQENNFASGNGQCNGILDQDNKIGVICGTACDNFEADTCSIMSFDIDLTPTASPTVTLQPICLATKTPSPGYIRLPTISTLPTDIPSVNRVTPTVFPSSLTPSESPIDPALPTESPTATTPTISFRPSEEAGTSTPSPTEVDTGLPTKPAKPTPRPSRQSSPAEPTAGPTKNNDRTRVPSLRPSRLRLPTVVPSEVRSPSAGPVSVPSPPPSEDLHPSTGGPTGMSFSYDYNFFYKFN